MEGDFRIEQWLIKPQLNTIVSPESRTIQLEPRIMEVLVYLAEHRDEVLRMDRIFQAVWPDTFVTEDVLTHAISEIRKAFGNDAKVPKFIQTILLRGYRRITTVSELKAAEVPGNAHDKGIIRRDIQPSNIILTPLDHVKVMHFGLARRLIYPDGSLSLEDTLSEVTTEETAAGTLPACCAGEESGLSAVCPPMHRRGSCRS